MYIYLGQIKFLEYCDHDRGLEAWVLLHIELIGVGTVPCYLNKKYVLPRLAIFFLLTTLTTDFGGRSMKVVPELRSLHLQASVRPYAVQLL